MISSIRRTMFWRFLVRRGESAVHGEFASEGSPSVQELDFFTLSSETL